MITYSDGWYIITLRIPDVQYFNALAALLGALVLARTIRWVRELLRI